MRESYQALLDAEEAVLAARSAIGSAIRAERESRELVPHQLAFDMHYSAAALHSLERGASWSWPAAYRAFVQLLGEEPPGGYRRPLRQR